MKRILVILQLILIFSILGCQKISGILGIDFVKVDLGVLNQTDVSQESLTLFIDSFMSELNETEPECSQTIDVPTSTTLSRSTVSEIYTNICGDYGPVIPALHTDDIEAIVESLFSDNQTIETNTFYKSVRFAYLLKSNENTVILTRVPNEGNTGFTQYILSRVDGELYFEIYSYGSYDEVSYSYHHEVFYENHYYSIEALNPIYAAFSTENLSTGEYVIKKFYFENEKRYTTVSSTLTLGNPSTQKMISFMDGELIMINVQSYSNHMLKLEYTDSRKNDYTLLKVNAFFLENWNELRQNANDHNTYFMYLNEEPVYEDYLVSVYAPNRIPAILFHYYEFSDNSFAFDGETIDLSNLQDDYNGFVKDYNSLLKQYNVDKTQTSYEDFLGIFDYFEGYMNPYFEER